MFSECTKLRYRVARLYVGCVGFERLSIFPGFPTTSNWWFRYCAGTYTVSVRGNVITFLGKANLRLVRVRENCNHSYRYLGNWHGFLKTGQHSPIGNFLFSPSTFEGFFSAKYKLLEVELNI